MQPEERDAALLWDMLDAARAVQVFTVGVTFEVYVADRRVQFAVECGLEILGEAAHHVSAEFRASHPEIPWSGIVGQRNVLAHEYGEINPERIWRVATERLPGLIRSPELLVPGESA
jgi:uncharacterized protein with HEPN domain